MIEKINYKEKVIQSVENEYEQFRIDELNQMPEQIFQDCHQIYFYREIADYIMSTLNELPEQHCRCLYEERGSILPCLWDYYLKSVYATVDSYKEIEQMIKSYNERYHTNILASETQM